MATYTYPTDNIKDWQTIYDAAIFRGVDATITMNSTIHITADIDKATADAIIADSTNGSLFVNKEARKGEAKAKSGSLMSEGYKYTRPSDGKTLGPFNLSLEDRATRRNLKDDVADGLVPLPQTVSQLDGTLSEVVTKADVDALYMALIDRGVYILGDGVNGDGSKGEAKLLLDIYAAKTQAELDAIMDTRV